MDKTRIRLGSRLRQVQVMVRLAKLLLQEL